MYSYSLMYFLSILQQSTESEGEEAKVNSNVSFGEFLQLYQELTDWLKSVQEATQEKSSSSLPLSQKYLKQVG